MEMAGTLATESEPHLRLYKETEQPKTCRHQLCRATMPALQEGS